ncbi:MAG: hypothetical protein ACI304_06380 [Lepagella sp.]
MKSEKNFFRMLGILLLMLLPMSILTSCSDDSGMSTDDLVGNWYGKRTYTNNGATKSQYLYLTLKSNKTGTMEYESPVSYSTAYFTWKVSGNKLICKGAYASTYDTDEDWTLECLIEDNKLKPSPNGGQFSEFTLTKSN